MGLLRAISRVIIGLLFLFSGYVKIIDPVGGGLMMEEYFKIIGIGGWHNLFIVVGAFLSIAEMLTGIAILVGLKMKVFCRVAFVFLLFFTILTLLLAVFDPVADCGCFGEALKLTNWETFFKNLFLLPFATLLNYQANRFIPVAPERWEWRFTAFFALFLVLLSVYSYRSLPMVDFMEFRTGTNIRERLSYSFEKNTPRFETILIYSKDGKEYQFSMENLPDSSYTFTDSRTREVGGRKSLSHMDFAVSDSAGDYITDSLLSISGPLFIATTPYAEFLGKRRAARLNRLYDTLLSRGIPMVLLTGSGNQENLALKREFGLKPSIYHTDKKTIYTINRSYGGVVYLNDAVVVSKWSTSGIPFRELDKFLIEDPELLAAKRRIREHLAVEFTAFALLVIIAAMRYFLRIFYKHKNDDTRKEQEP
jgi:triosephosphate isomerase